MVSRRTILQGALAATSLSIVASDTWSPPATRVGAATVLDHPSLYKVVFDQRFAAARAFGRDAEWRGLAARGFGGDITQVWFNDLNPRWQQGRAPVAGMTAYGVLFCLEHLARDARMRVVHRAVHRYPGHETLYSWVIA